MANRNFSRAMRRKTQWAGFGDAAGAANIPAWVAGAVGTPAIVSQAMIVQNAAGLIDEEITITRMIGRIGVTIDVATAGSRGAIAIGCLVARVTAISAGVASLPSPEDDPDSDWLYYAVLPVLNPATADTDGPLSMYTYDFDVKGQRVVRSGETPVWLMESQTVNCEAFVGGRYLAKLP